MSNALETGKKCLQWRRSQKLEKPLKKQRKEDSKKKALPECMRRTPRKRNILILLLQRKGESINKSRGNP